MKFGLIFVAALVLSAFAAHALLQDPGYVVINFRGYLIEMSVPVTLAAIGLLIFLVWFVLKLIKAPRKLGEAAARYRSGRAGARLTRGMIEVAEGNFAKGERLLARTAHKSDAPLLNYLQAARAAHLLGDGERRDAWLRQAYEQTPEAATAVLLTQAELQLDQQQYESALATLRTLTDDTPNHARALELLGRLYFRLEDWDSLEALLPKLKKYARVDTETLNSWALQVRKHQLEVAADGTTVNLVWQAIPRGERKLDALRDIWIQSLIRTGMHEQAAKQISQELKRSWRKPMVQMYGMVEADNATKQLKQAEKWLQQHGEDPDLLLAAARLCLRNELWGKARSYLETVIALRPTPEAYQELGRLFMHLGDDEAAADAFRNGLFLVSGSPMPDVPLLETDANTEEEPIRIEDQGDGD